MRKTILFVIICIVLGSFAYAQPNTIPQISTLASEFDANQTGVSATITSTICYMSTASADTMNYCGWVFHNVPIPRYAYIDNATIQVFFAATTADDPSVRLISELSDNASIFGTNANNLTGRTLGLHTVNWVVVGVGKVYANSPNISLLIQQVVNQSTWTNGSYLMIASGEIANTAGAISTFNSATSEPALLNLEFNDNQNPIYTQVFLNDTFTQSDSQTYNLTINCTDPEGDHMVHYFTNSTNFGIEYNTGDFIFIPYNNVTGAIDIAFSCDDDMGNSTRIWEPTHGVPAGCTYDCSTNPVITSNTDCGGTDLIVTGSGTFTLKAIMSNFAKAYLYVASCIFYVDGANGGVLYRG